MTKLTLPVVDRVLARKVALRLLPLAGLLYFIATIDRISLGLSAVHGLNEDLGMTTTMFGFAAGLFAIGYMLFEVPSNAVLVRFGSRKWITRIMLTWGLVQIASAFVTSPELLYLSRFLLGVAEAGFVPGMIYWMTLWFPAQRLARIIGIFAAAGLSANVFGPVIANALVDLNSGIGWDFHPWRFLILGTGLLAVLAAPATWIWLTDRPAEARWLTAEEKARWQATIARDAAHVEAHGLTGFGAALKSKWTWLHGIAYFVIPYGSVALAFFMPIMVAGLVERFDLQVNAYGAAALTGLPFAVAITVLLFVVPIADRTQRHGAVIAVCLLVGAVGIAIAVLATDPFLTFLGLSLLASGTFAGIPINFSIVSKYAVGAAGAAVAAVVNSLGTAGGFFGPYITGFLSDLFGNTDAALWIMAVILVIGAGLYYFLDRAVTRANGVERRGALVA